MSETAPSAKPFSLACQQGRFDEAAAIARAADRLMAEAVHDALIGVHHELRPAYRTALER